MLIDDSNNLIILYKSNKNNDYNLSIWNINTKKLIYDFPLGLVEYNPALSFGQFSFVACKNRNILIKSNNTSKLFKLNLDSIGKIPIAYFESNVNAVMVSKDTVYFYNKSIGNNLNYKWFFGDGETSTELNPKHVYNKHGYYTVSLVAYGKNDTVVYRRNNYIYVVNKYIAKFEQEHRIGDNYLLFEPNNYSNGDLRICTFKWIVADTILYNINPKYLLTKPGKYDVTLIITDGFTSDTMTKKDYLQVKQKFIQNADLKKYLVLPDLKLDITANTVKEYSGSYYVLANSKEINGHFRFFMVDKKDFYITKSNVFPKNCYVEFINMEVLNQNKLLVNIPSAKQYALSIFNLFTSDTTSFFDSLDRASVSITQFLKLKDSLFVGGNLNGYYLPNYPYRANLSFLCNISNKEEANYIKFRSEQINASSTPYRGGTYFRSYYLPYRDSLLIFTSGLEYSEPVHKDGNVYRIYNYYLDKSTINFKTDIDSQYVLTLNNRHYLKTREETYLDHKNIPEIYNIKSTFVPSNVIKLNQQRLLSLDMSTSDFYVFDGTKNVGNIISNKNVRCKCIYELNDDVFVVGGQNSDGKAILSFLSNRDFSQLDVIVLDALYGAVRDILKTSTGEYLLLVENSVIGEKENVVLVECRDFLQKFVSISEQPNLNIENYVYTIKDNMLIIDVETGTKEISKIYIYDNLGRIVSNANSAKYWLQHSSIYIDLSTLNLLANQMYFFSLHSKNEIKTGKFLLLK